MTVKFPSKNTAERRQWRRPGATAVTLALGVASLIDVQAFAFQARPAPPVPRPTTPAPQSALPPSAPAAPAAAVPLPAGYTIGPEDVLSIVFWRDKDMSSDVSVRPDGKISLPLLNDVQAAGLTPTELKDQLTQQSKRFVEDASVTVVVKQINSRKIFILGEVGKPGPYMLGGPTTILQFISMAGGFKDFAKRDKISIMRTENGKAVSHGFNYDE